VCRNHVAQDKNTSKVFKQLAEIVEFCKRNFISVRNMHFVLPLNTLSAKLLLQIEHESKAEEKSDIIIFL